MIRKRTHWMSFVLAITVVLFVVVPNAIAQIPSGLFGSHLAYHRGLCDLGGHMDEKRRHKHL